MSRIKRKKGLNNISGKKLAQFEAAGVHPSNTLQPLPGTIAARMEGLRGPKRSRRDEPDARGDQKRVHPDRPKQSPERRALAARIQARDEKTCQRCGCPGTEVHHLFKVGSHKELELIDANCVLLCAWCHRLGPDAAHKGNETAVRHWRARNYAPFAAIYQADIDRPTLDARYSGGEA